MSTEKIIQEVENWKSYMNQDFNISIVGFGKMGALHSGILNLLKPGCVKAVVEKGRLITFGASKIIKCTKFYRDLDEMLRKNNPDTVYVTTPAGSHYNIISRLLESQVENIFVEKPPTIDSQQLGILINKKGSGKRVMVGFQKRFALPFRHAKNIISEGEIGEIENVSSYIKSGDILTPTDRFDNIGRGVLLDLGIHLVDLLNWILKIDTVKSSSFKKIFTNVDDYFEFTMKTAKGADVFVETTWSSPEHRVPLTYIMIRGSKGTLEVTEDYLRVEYTQNYPEKRNRLELYKPHYYQSTPPVNLGDPEYTLENMHFLQSICSSEEPLTSLENVRQTMYLVDQLYRKAQM
jgi:predicted dehydrogenase